MASAALAVTCCRHARVPGKDETMPKMTSGSSAPARISAKRVAMWRI
jgi:hypothetical protein